MRRETRLAHYGRPKAPGPANPPVVRASTILHDSLESYEDTLARRAVDETVLSYGRRGTTTAHALMEAITDLEGGEGTWLFPTGVAALAGSLQACLKSGDHLLVSETAFYATNVVCERFLEPNGVTVDRIPWDATDLSAWLKPETRAVFVESPGSDLMEVMDLPAICESAHAAGALVLADNTFGSGWLYRPLELGCDVSIIAGTKYLGGHADVMMGSACARGDAAGLLREAIPALGQTLAPDEAYATLRGIRTLNLRLERHAESASKVAGWLSKRDEVLQLFSPTRKGHPGQATWQRDGEGGNGLLTIALRGDVDLSRLLKALALFSVGSSWGGFESLAKPVKDFAHRTAATGLNGAQLLRLHVGLEHPDDLIADLAQAFDSLD